MTLFELLTAGKIDEFNAKRGARVTLDFFAADLSGLSLVGADLSGANMEKADLSGADLTGAVLAKANLCGADLTGATLDKCVAIRARLREAYLGDARANGAEFSGADFTEADLTGFTCEQGRFAGARFKDAVLTRAVLPGCDFSEGRFANADLRDADLTGAVLINAELLRANASGARLVGADLTGARLAGAVLKSAHLAGANLTGADLSGVDLTGADLTGANLERADMFDVVAEPEALKLAKLPAGVEAAPATDAGDTHVELHFEDPSVAVSVGGCAVFWENADGEDTFALRAIVAPNAKPFRGASQALAIPIDQVLSRAVLPTPTGFECAVFLDRPAGVELSVLSLDAAGNFGAPRSVRLGYTPVVKPVLVPDGEGFLIYGIGRQGALSVHRFDGTVLHELMRAPAGTYRGFCGRLDPILLGKGGTVAAVRKDGIGKLMSAPTGYPGRLTTAAYRGTDGEQIALAWVGKGEKGLRFQALGVDAEPTRLDIKAEIGAIDLRAVGDRWLLVYTREAVGDDDLTLPMGVWLPGGKPFPLLDGLDRIDIEDVRLLPGDKPRVAMITLGEDLIVVEVLAEGGAVIARFGDMEIGA
ncbi:MAG: pentapeptide repeat-containing protein [Pseudomonadota bacterium]|nr:pentapeptide repeat-containing protein [Pseudomonadota bacterium]